jgi:hypothetical protein
MGVRVYDPTIGRFLSLDPVHGGSANAYEYAGGDPVNSYDLDGRCNKECHEARACMSVGYTNCLFVMALSGSARGLPSASVTPTSTGRSAHDGAVTQEPTSTTTGSHASSRAVAGTTDRPATTTTENC